MEELDQEARSRGARGDEPGRSPSVTAVIPTHNRPELMRRALASVLAQEYDGELDVIIVFDRSEPDPTLADDDGPRRVRVLSNDRTPGLAGSRNTGVLAATGTLVAFLDDDDQWLPTKLAAQARAMAAEPGSEFCSTAMLVDYDGRETVRLAGTERVTLDDLVRSRMAMLHSSSFVMDRTALSTGSAWSTRRSRGACPRTGTSCCGPHGGGPWSTSTIP